MLATAGADFDQMNGGILMRRGPVHQPHTRRTTVLWGPPGTDPKIQFLVPYVSDSQHKEIFAPAQAKGNPHVAS